MVFISCWGKTVGSLFIEDLGMTVVIWGYGWVNFLGLVQRGFDGHRLFTVFRLVPCCFDMYSVTGKGVRTPVNSRVKRLEPRVSQDESVMSQVCDKESQFLCHFALSYPEVTKVSDRSLTVIRSIYVVEGVGVTIRARTSRAAYSPVMTTVLRRRHRILVMDSCLSQQSSITCTIVTHS